MSNTQVLESKIKELSQAYYGGQSVVTDETFDALVDELRKIDPGNPVLTQVGWGFDVSKSNLTKVTHTYGKVGSLDKVKSVRGVVKNLGEKNLIGTPKLDGLTVVAYYTNGIFTRGVTRGDGTTGQDVTYKIKDKVPAVIGEFTGAIRGEFILPLTNWKKFYPDAPSPRNTASGVINRKSVSDEELSRFEYIVYQVVGGNIAFDEKDDMLFWLKDAGFKVVPFGVYPSLKCEPEYMKSEIDRMSKELDLPLDGMVLEDNLLVTENGNGRVIADQVAYKVQNDTAVARIKSIKWSLTRTGKYTPVAILEPTELSGATIRRASVYNAEYVEKHKLGAGALVTIVRSGEIIPVVLDVIEPSDEALPTHTEDGEPLVREGTDLKLASESSNHLTRARLIHWIERIGATDGIGGKVLDKVLEELGIDKIQDIYTKDYDVNSLHGLNGFGESTTGKVHEMFSKLKSPITPKRFLIALGLPSLAGSSAEKLIASVGLDGILEGKVTSSTKIKGVNKNAIGGIVSNIDLIKEIASLVKFKEVDPAPTTSQEVRFKVALTGKLNNGRKRSELEKLLKENGIGTGDVKSGTKYLITNNPDPTSSKGKKAKKEGIEIITEDAFLAKYNLSY
ncbi:DNA ligase [Bacillus phage SP-15]|uniref:DNA ligase (NAD(+)) n=1 Tax=Bacillus phage SP-15 TaxID=1792032 RepID=A0A127AYW8_9CAUD|nr:NAD-dependent DNA ligase [Bacillus phage SP-15]AMM44941.1 DNA ligase [Bacillus phage SP-15]